MLKRLSVRALASVWLLATVSLVQAHHSAASVDESKTLSVSGTLKEFDFSAPHGQIIVVSLNGNGAEVQTKVSTIAPAGLIRQGFKPRDFESGQKVEMTYHPNRNYEFGGIMLTLTLQDGRVVKGNIY
jgi:hypothetical protein